MGLDPVKWRRMDFEDFLIAREGWSEGLLFTEFLFWRQTVIIAQTLGQKKSEMDKVWQNPLNPGNATKMVVYKGTQMTEGQARKLAKLKNKPTDG